jgi:molybdopterin synthase sulfur carrier subunit
VQVKVRFFARCREIVGEKEKEVELEGGMRLMDIIDFLMSEYPELKKETLLTSLNHTYVNRNAELNDNDEIAVFPPVSGG